MATLDRNLRKQLEKQVRQARRVAEIGAHQTLEHLAVHRYEPWDTLTAEQRALRNRLRAHGRQLGDRREKNGDQSIVRLTAECAYEHWHRLLFARFLAENDLLIEPTSGVAIALDEVRELAREQNVDWLSLASGFAQGMLPQIFRTGDPVLEVALPPETRQALEAMLEELPRDVFLAEDSLGWVYQFWQAEQKEAVNKSGDKIGADELPAVTQLFTEDYMVLFLLHNTLGAWWAGKVLAAKPDLAREATDEDALRRACALPNYEWTYLRFVRDDGGPWRPAAGTFDGWPTAAKDITMLDPCMGSGHFLVFALPIMVQMRMSEEGLTLAEAVDAVLRDNLFGLEIDPRCTQIAAFNLALAAWKLAGHRTLPQLNLACSGLAPGVSREEWQALANGDQNLRIALGHLYDLFAQAPILGSLLEPRKTKLPIGVSWSNVLPVATKAIKHSARVETQEAAVTAQGMARAAEVLSTRFSLVATNVPYLGRGKQGPALQDYCERVHTSAKSDLATCFVERSRQFCVSEGVIALVSPQNWWFSPGYYAFRQQLLSRDSLNVLVTLGEEAWQSFGDRGPVASLLVATATAPNRVVNIAAIDALPHKTIDAKLCELESGTLINLAQSDVIANPDSRLAFDTVDSQNLLAKSCESWQGLVTSDNLRFMFCFWEAWECGWVPFISSPAKTRMYGGREKVLYWMNGVGPLHQEGKAHNFPPVSALGRRGVLVSQVRSLSGTIYSGEIFAHGSSPIIPSDDSMLLALWTFVSSAEYREAVRNIDKKLAVTNSTLLKVEFDLEYWQKIAYAQFPDGLPKPHSNDPTQWLFNGHPKGSDAPLHVAVARLAGYRWPRQTGSEFMDCPALGLDGLEKHADADGIVCLPALRGEASAAERLQALLAAAFGSEWSAGKLNELLNAVGFGGKTLDDWLRDGFFEQHSALFHNRPFVWHIWDGRKDGFAALVNYHHLAAPNGDGKRTLEKLTHSYLGDWIARQRADAQNGVDGAEGRLTAALHLKSELEKIIAGENPYDIFVRWKPLHQQPLGWEPDINDGVRLNIRPFMTAKPMGARGKNACILRVTPKSVKWDKDRGKEPRRDKADFPWFWSWDGESDDFTSGAEFDGNRWNGLHYSLKTKREARERAKGKS